MIPLFTNQEYASSLARDKLLLECEYCHKPYQKDKRNITFTLNHPRRDKHSKIIKNGNCLYCSRSCAALATRDRTGGRATTIQSCKNCGTPVKRTTKDFNTSKSGNFFCSHSCRAIYNNTHKTTGIRVSKLELWLQKKLLAQYPKLEIHFNRKDAIGSELDIYFPNIKLGFELNGIFHYENVYGFDKLEKTQNNDTRKFQSCIERGISLCVIDTTSQKYFKEAGSTKFLKIIQEVLSRKGIEPLSQM